MLSGFPLPTLDRVGASLGQNLDAKQVVSDWFETFAKCAESGDVKGVSRLFFTESYWLALTWDFRTFIGRDRIERFLSDRLSLSQMKKFKLRDEYVGLQQPSPDLAWIGFMFDFEVGDTGYASGIGRLVPQSDGTWKAHCLYTNLEDLKGFPENLGPLRNSESDHGFWVAQRQREVAFEDRDPTVLVIGGAQTGLIVAARLKMLGLSALVVEKSAKLGDSWRDRYKALCLHDPVWFDHMPYLPFPPNWPVYTPAEKLASWLEIYAEAMELNVWTSCEVTKAVHHKGSDLWTVTAKYANGKERVLEGVKHVVFATGFHGSQPKIPSYPGTDSFKGQILHSSQYNLASDHVGKKVIVVGACNSAHDIGADCYHHGIDITMYQRSSTYVMSQKSYFQTAFEGFYSENSLPTDVADRMGASFPHSFSANGFAQRSTAQIAKLDKPLLEGLEKRGFRYNMGIEGSGALLLALTNAGGYYLDVGASQLIIDGKIKLKNNSLLQTFIETGLKFEDGSELPADVVIYATGYGDARSAIRKICGDEVAEKCNPVWGLNAEGELQGAWRDMGVPGLWYAMGNLAWDRFHSKHLALQIKAMEENIFGPRYSRSE